MVKVKMYSTVEGNARVGDEVDVDAARAAFLVVNGKATYVDEADAEHLPPVGGARVEGQQAGVEPANKRKAKVAKAEAEKEGAPAGVESAPAKKEGAKTSR